MLHGNPGLASKGVAVCSVEGHLSHSTGSLILDFIVAEVNLHEPLIGVLLQGLADEASTCSHTLQFR